MWWRVFHGWGEGGGATPSVQVIELRFVIKALDLPVSVGCIWLPGSTDWEFRQSYFVAIPGHGKSRVRDAWYGPDPTVGLWGAATSLLGHYRRAIDASQTPVLEWFIPNGNYALGRYFDTPAERVDGGMVFRCPGMPGGLRRPPG